MRRYLVVANQTLGGDKLLQAVQERLAAGSCHFRIVVPATQLAQLDAATYAASMAGFPMPPPPPEADEDAGSIALARLRHGLELFERIGAVADGDIGDADPLEAIRDALEDYEADEIILSTLPTSISRWLRMDLPSRCERRFDVPLTVVTAPADRPLAAT